MKKHAFTLAEQMIVLILVGIIASAVTVVVRPANISNEALKKAGKSLFVQVEFATKQMVARNARNNTLTRMVDASGEFSIASTSSLDRMLALYKKNLMGLRSATLETNYAALKLTDGTTTLSSLSASSFKGFTLKNGAYFGVKLNGNCTTEITYIYDPSTPELRNKKNTCGIIFIDINAENSPNQLGYDQYILALGKRGIK